MNEKDQDIVANLEQVPYGSVVDVLIEAVEAQLPGNRTATVIAIRLAIPVHLSPARVLTSRAIVERFPTCPLIDMEH